MSPHRKARTVSLRRDAALVRAEALTRLEGGALSDAQRRVIGEYRDGAVAADHVVATAKSRARHPQ